MWVALMVAVLLAGEVVVVAAPEVFKTEAACLAKQAEVEALIKGGKVEAMSKHALACVKVTPR